MCRCVLSLLIPTHLFFLRWVTSCIYLCWPFKSGSSVPVFCSYVGLCKCVMSCHCLFLVCSSFVASSRLCFMIVAFLGNSMCVCFCWPFQCGSSIAVLVFVLVIVNVSMCFVIICSSYSFGAFRGCVSSLWPLLDISVDRSYTMLLRSCVCWRHACTKYTLSLSLTLEE